MVDLTMIVEEGKKAIQNANSLHALEEVHSQIFGKKGLLSEYLKNVGRLSVAERPLAGQAANQAKISLQQSVEDKKIVLRENALTIQLTSEKIDTTLPGKGLELGSLHPITQTRQRIESFFRTAGFDLIEGPEIEDEYHNFEALNIPLFHPARAMHDTFYLKDHTYLLRTHTSTVQIRVMEKMKPPLRLIAAGRVYRCDSDLRHTPMFHQVEGLVVDKTANFSELKGILDLFLRDFFGNERLPTRFRSSYFPFTEPSAEVDVACVLCQGKGCRTCSFSGWLEVLGCGMVHPKVLKEAGLNPEEYQGYAFGMGIDRLTMLRHKIVDLRMMFENDLRFLDQF